MQEDLPLPSTQGRAYDLSKVDDKLRKRLLKNRCYDNPALRFNTELTTDAN